MNSERISEIRKFINDVHSCQEGLSAIIEAEKEYRDNLPDNLDETEKYFRAEEAIDQLNEVLDQLNECVDLSSELI